jgi:hypothetical protein
MGAVTDEEPPVVEGTGAVVPARADEAVRSVRAVHVPMVFMRVSCGWHMSVPSPETQIDAMSLRRTFGSSAVGVHSAYDLPRMASLKPQRAF